MPAITLGYSQIEQQLRLVRRRRNWLTVQQAVYLCGGMMLLGIALLIVLALRSERLIFTIAFWLTLTSISASGAAAMRLIWQRWIREADTPRWIDRVAQLDDRLATLVAHQGTKRPPRLMATLVSQLFVLRYRWEAATLVPRRVPRSVYFFAAAVVALISASFLERPPATPQRFPHAKTAAQNRSNPPDANGRVVRMQGQRSDGSAGNEPGDGGDGSDSGAGGAKRSDGARGGKAMSGGAGGNELRRSAKADAIKGDKMRPGTDAKALEKGLEPALPERLQDMIRQAFQHPPVESGPRSTEGDRQQGKRGKPDEQTSGKGEQQARADGQPNRDPNQARQDPAAVPPVKPDGSEAGRGANGGGGAGQGTKGIYGAQARPGGQEPAAKKFELKLALLGQSSRATMEQQKSKRSSVSDVGVPMDQSSTNAPLNPNQRADEPLVRGEIPAEHEAMVKRIFSRPE